MKLNTLPKDLLVELVSELQDRKEKEYSDYVVLSAIGPDHLSVWRLENEYEMKNWLVFELVILRKNMVGDDYISAFLEELRKMPLGKRSEYCKEKLRDIELNDLMDLFRKTTSAFIIIKGKCLTGNIDNLPLEY